MDGMLIDGWTYSFCLANGSSKRPTDGPARCTLMFNVALYMHMSAAKVNSTNRIFSGKLLRPHGSRGQ